ncbi:hypothetical protein FACS1894110_00200 [Spirochaetia bacterium]|nr:hypothetical protein FACS1894110_00200 [Spirochaetia bacterium]
MGSMKILSSVIENIIFVIIVVMIIGILIVVNKLRKKGKLNSPSLGDSEFSANAQGAGKNSDFSLRRFACSTGLDKNQTRMLEFVLKNDEVTDPAESLRAPELLDRHFKKAYQTITDGTAKPDTQERLALLFSIRNILENSNITSTRQIAENTDTVITVGKESYTSRVLSAKGKNLVVENPRNSGGESVKPERNSRVTLSFFARSEKGFSVETQVVGIEESEDVSRLRLAHSNRLQYQSKRQFLRKQTAIPADFYLVRLENIEKEKKLVVEKEKLSGKIMNISIGGCAIQTNSSIASGVRLKIEFSPTTALKAAVLGQEPRTNQNGTTMVMHIKFLKVPRKSMNAINALVFEYSDG